MDEPCTTRKSAEAAAGPCNKQRTISILSQEAWWRNAERPPSKKFRSDRLAEILHGVGTLLVVSRGNSALYCVSEAAGEIEVTPYRLPGPMGLAVADGRMAIGCAMDIRTFVDISGGDDEQAYFLPAAVHSTGAVSVHDVAWGMHGSLWFTNTLFSSVCTVEGAGFRHRWRPAFLRGDPIASDACHLNGMVVSNDDVRYATALAAVDLEQGWRSVGPDCGVVIDHSGEILCESLSLPHSPMLINNQLYLLESGWGRVLTLAAKPSLFAEIDGVARGLAASSSTLFVGRSPVRTSSGAVAEILSRRFERTHECAIHAFSYSGVALAEFRLPFVGEISSIHYVPNSRVTLLMPSAEQRASTFVVELG